MQDGSVWQDWREYGSGGLQEHGPHRACLDALTLCPQPCYNGAGWSCAAGPSMAALSPFLSSSRLHTAPFRRSHTALPPMMTLLLPHVQCSSEARSHMSCSAMRPKPVCCSGNGYVHFPAELTHATVKTLVLSRNLLNLAAQQQSVAPVVNPVLRVEVSFVSFC